MFVWCVDKGLKSIQLEPTNGDAGVCGKEPTEAPVSSVPAASRVMGGKEFLSDQLP